MIDNTAFINPFPGLRAFEEHEDILFFGREKQVDELLKKLRLVRFLSVIGSSGSGKSSLVKSGLIPALHSGFMSGAGSQWKICSLRPGNDPIGNMANALVNSVLYENQTTEENLLYTSITESTLRRSNFGLIEAYKQAGLNPRQNLLILVDQFEELFRFSSYEKKAMEGRRDSVAFINLLIKAAEQKEVPIYIVFTMRSDFLGECTQFRGLPEAINEGQYLVPRMTREERREAITGPVAVGGATMSPRLLNQLLNDVGDNPDQLPILQHALMRTWENWYGENQESNDPEPIDVNNYEHIGTMAHALSQHAEEAYAELKTTGERQICEVMFKAITDKGFSVTGIRRPRKLAEISELAGAQSTDVIAVIDIFRKNGRAFLMPPQGIELSDDSIIDISHESLMRVWDRLILWVDEENQSAEIYLRLCEAADLYETGKGGLLRDPELQVAWKWKEENNPNATWAARYNSLFEKAIIFLEHSKQEYELELTYKELAQKQSLRRARRITVIISIIALAAFMLSIYSFQLRNLATRQTKIAEKKSKEAQSQRKQALLQRKIAVDQQRLAEQSKEVALEQKSIAEGAKKKSEVSEKNALLQKTIAEQQKSYAERQKVISETNAKLARQQQGIAETQTGKAVANEKVAVEQKQISTRLRDLAESRNLAYESMLLLNDNKNEESRQGALKAYQLNNDNKGPLQSNDIYSALYFNWVSSINNKNVLGLHKYPVRNIVALPQADQFISADESGRMFLLNGNNGILQPITSYDLKEDARVVAPIPGTSNILVLTAEGNAIILQVSGNAIKELSRIKFEGIGKSVLFDKGELVIISNKGIAEYALNNNNLAPKKFTPSFNLDAIVATNNGIYLTAGNNIFLYKTVADIPDKPANEYRLNAKVLSLAVDPSNTYLAAGTYDGGIWLKNIKTDGKEVSFSLHASAINDIQFRPGITDGSIQLATASSDQTVKLLDVGAVMLSRNTDDIITLRNHTKWVYKVAYSTNGENLYTASEDKRIMGWYATMAGIFKELKKNKK
ncbi:nSTAND1 domain-containing NTPase [Mucilaginibacter polytrichastri]|uniref:Novel STAND NTPase 1 domain-containing protein n=1 Tax=Mucilaginibacter polytrichastri TaxID=1302689 RepID=A0A1Q5ZYG8_9SPHI|nr:hypothetical protein [Mucilaginibacter polytrichastri]OKS86815.1 hypothetical protein RG47T_2272 [Mucilaginibacter polytrichastri]SFT22818.1 hypothetical protein SAMN04487890_11966 [Mucilaginibacter polytrichastri]